MPLIVPADIDSWIGKSVAAERQAELVSAIAYAQSWIGRAAGIRSLEKEAAAVTFFLDGATAFGSDLWLPSDIRPMWHDGTDLATVSEAGTALTVAVGYDSSADVIIRGANKLERVSLHRTAGWLRWNAQNVEVACTVGFDSDPDATVLPVPHDVRRLVAEVAWLLFQSSSWVGRGSVAKVGSSVSITNALSPAASDTLDLLRGL